MQYGRGAAGWPGRLGCTAPGQLCAPHDAGPRAGWVGADRADRVSCGATACSALKFGPTRMDRNEPILRRPRESPRVTTGIPYMCPLDRHTWDVRHRTGATPPSSDAWALRARRRMTPRARSSGGPLRLVVRVVRVDASAGGRAALSPGSEKTGLLRRAAGCSPPGGPVGSEPASLHARKPPMPAGPPYLPFSHVAVQPSLRNGRSGACRDHPRMCRPSPPAQTPSLEVLA